MLIVGKAVFAVLDHNINLVRLLFLNLNASEHNTRLPSRLHARGGGFGHGGYLDARTYAAAHRLHSPLCRPLQADRSQVAGG